MKLFARFKNWYLDRRFAKVTGMPGHERVYWEWYDRTVVTAASTLENRFMNFKYIVEVNHNSFFEDDFISWVPAKEFDQYVWPNRELHECSVWSIVRGERDLWDGKFHFNEMGGSDHVFVATNNEKDAIMIALKWA